MSETLRVVARFCDGRMLKGTTQDFKPASPRFHLAPAEGGAAAEQLARESLARAG